MRNVSDQEIAEARTVAELKDREAEKAWQYVEELKRERRRYLAFSETIAMRDSLRPWETTGTITEENDPLRHLTPEEREDILSKIQPRKASDMKLKATSWGAIQGVVRE